jgi:hypothetical protein
VLAHTLSGVERQVEESRAVEVQANALLTRIPADALECMVTTGCTSSAVYAECW